MNADGEAFLVLELGGRFFGIEVERIEAVVPFTTPGPMPYCPSGFLGGLIHHGEFLGVIHLATPLGSEAVTDPDRAVIAVISWVGGTIGFVAERSHGLFRPENDGEGVHVLGRWEGPYHRRTVRWRERDVHLLDMEALLEGLAARVAGECGEGAACVS
jgi:chemotaxis signal transduction protein